MTKSYYPLNGNTLYLGSSSSVAPIQLLASPFNPSSTTNTAGGIQINALFIPPTSNNAIANNKRESKKPYDKQKRRQNSPHSSSSSITSDDAQLKPRLKAISKKKAVELLSDDQKRANHIASEQKRKANIRIGFEKLVDIVPALSNGHRSEALILQKCEYYALA